MKKIISIFLIAISTINCEAQLLKKLKDKAQQAVEITEDINKNDNNKKEDNKEEENNNSTNTNSINNKKSEKSSWVPDSFCTKVFVLSAGETLLYDETKVYEKQNEIGYMFIIEDNSSNYFLVKDGIKTGPFKNPPLKENGIQSAIENDESNEKENEFSLKGKITIGSDIDPIVQKYSKTISNKLYIAFNGTNYGPYDYIGKIIVSPDKKKFFAAVVIGGENEMMYKMGMGNTYIVNESGLKIKTGDSKSIMLQLNVNQNFKAAAITTMNSTNQQIMIISSSGKKQESTLNDFSNSKQILIIGDNGDIVNVPVQSPTQLMVNGNEAASFSTPIKNENLLYLMNDYKKSVYYQDGKLYRGDGTEEKLSGLIFPKFLVINGRLTVNYFKTLRKEDGTKEIWHCKRHL